MEDLWIPHEVFVSDKYMNLSNSGKVLLFGMWLCCNEWGQPDVGIVRITQEEMKQRTKLSPRTIVRASKDLVDAGFIWLYAGQRSLYGLALKAGATMYGALTAGQRRLVEIIKPGTKCPHSIKALGHAKHLDDLKWALAEQDCRCYVCAIGNGLVLHHLTYERYGKELLEDCVLLCERCHEAVNKV